MTATSYQSGSGIRSPTASYPGLYPYPQTTQGGNYTYFSTQDHGHIQIPSMNPSAYNTDPYGYSDAPRSEHHRSSSPYGRSPSHGVPTSTTPPPVSPTTPEESTIKKKRKRADARQLKVLNETYNRTAFPSTEERLALAKELDMTARSVQIWCAVVPHSQSVYPMIIRSLGSKTKGNPCGRLTANHLPWDLHPSHSL